MCNGKFWELFYSLDCVLRTHAFQTLVICFRGLRAKLEMNSGSWHFPVSLHMQCKLHMREHFPSTEGFILHMPHAVFSSVLGNLEHFYLMLPYQKPEFCGGTSYECNLFMMEHYPLKKTHLRQKEPFISDFLYSAEKRW